MTAGGVLEAFAEAVGQKEPVTCAGGRTQWSVGGTPEPEAREVHAPSGVVAHEPGEMIVRVRAGTTLAELLAATAIGGQHVTLEADRPEQATVGGILACGRSGPRRLGWGPIRDSLLEATFVDHRGRLVRAGAPLVKNVTGFDLCRLLVGSVGTLGFIAEVVLRCRPRAELEKWWAADGADPFAVARVLYRPLSVLWDGTTTWVGLAGYGVDVEDQAAAVLRPAGFRPADGPPQLPAGGRRSMAPAALRQLGSTEGRWVAEIGTGAVHVSDEAAGSIGPRPVDPGVVELHRRLKERFDPDGRLNPGRTPLAA